MPLWRTLIAASSFFWLAVTTSNAATEAGTSIVNQATLIYREEASGMTVEVLSNTSSVIVSSLLQFELRSPLEITASAGESVQFSHQIENTGNVAAAFQVLAENQLADSGDLINLLVYVDSNNNGVVDPAELLVVDAISLDPGESVGLILTGVIPQELRGDDEIELLLQAQAVDAPEKIQTVRDLVRIKPESDLLLSLLTNSTCDIERFSDETISVQINGVNRSETLPQAQSIIIDGAARTGVLSILELPEGTTLKANETPEVVAFQGVFVVQSGGPSAQWMRYEQWDGSSKLTRVGLLAPQSNYELNETVSAAFRLVVLEDAPTTAQLFMATIDVDNDGQFDSESNAACLLVASPSAAVEQAIRFLEPAIALQRAGITPEFASDNDFIDASVYRLNGSELDSTTDLSSLSAPSYSLPLNGVYLELVATVDEAQLIKDGSGTKFVVVQLSSQNTLDQTSVLLRETATDSDVYRSIRPILLSQTIAAEGEFCPGNSTAVLPATPDFESDVDVCVLQSEIDDTLLVQFENSRGGVLSTDTAVVDPVSRVFDSTSLAGVAGVTVSILENGVLALHPLTGAPLQLVTDEQGRYSIPRLEAGTQYSISVDVVEGYVFPSTVDASQFTNLNVIPASFGLSQVENTLLGGLQNASGIFSVVNGDIPPVIDIPLDPSNSNALLLINKNVEADTVEPGGMVAYTIDVSNSSNGDMKNLAVLDGPAFGFRYLPGSATYDGDRIADPERLQLPESAVNSIAAGENQSIAVRSGLRFRLPNLPANTTATLRYFMQATAGAIDGSGVNRAVANANTESDLLLTTASAEARVSVSRAGVLSDSATLFGKVYVDSSCDAIQNQGEWPIGGVRLYLSDGTFVITDEDGQYSLFGLQPGLHVLKLDVSTLPQGLVLQPFDTAQAADPESRFVDLSNGDFHRADFASFCPQQHVDVVFEEIKNRNEDLRNAWLLSEAERFNPEANSPRDGGVFNADTQGDLSQAFIGFPRSQDDRQRGKLNAGAEPNRAVADSVTRKDSTDGTVLRAREETTRKMGDPAELVKEITSAQAKVGTWLWPEIDLSWDGRFMAVVIAGIDPVLYVNDKPVARTQVGEQIVNRREQAQIIAWYGVKLLPGNNAVEVRTKDSFGNDRVLLSRIVRRPSAGVRLMLRAPQDTLEADSGRTKLPIDVVITDGNNNPASGVYFVTLNSNGGTFAEPDLQLREPGMQVRVENGYAKVHLNSTALTGNVTVRARTGALEAKLEIVQIAEARPLIGAGFVKLGAQWNRSEDGIQSRQTLEDEFEIDARTALFLKGRVKNDMHLTLAYDTQRKQIDSFLRDLNPNAFYATYGDSSLRGVEAQSRSKLFVKLEKNKNSIMWGDYLTDSQATQIDLAKTQRTLTGVNAFLENETTRIQMFAAQQTSDFASEEIPGNGTSMLFQLSRAPIETNSETVERIVRDRDNPGLVISTETLTRHIDYSIDSVNGQLRFADVVPTVDAELNPVFIRVNYALSSNHDEYLVSGIRMQETINESSHLGVSITTDQNPLNPFYIAGVEAETKLNNTLKISGSAAMQRFSNTETTGYAQRLQLEHTGSERRDYRTLMSWARATAEFDNPSAGISSGRAEWNLEHRRTLGNKVKALVESSYSESLTARDRFGSAGFRVEKSFSDWSAQFGVRHTQSTQGASNLRFNSFLLGVEKRFTFNADKRGSVGVEYEQAFSDRSRHRIGVTGRLQLMKHVALYARYERDLGLSSLSLLDNQGSTQLLTAGVESDVLPDTQLYSEYRMQGSFGGESIEAITGVRGRYEIEPGLDISPSLEFIDVLDDDSEQDSIAVSLGISDTRNPNRKLATQAEIRETQDIRYYGFRGTVAQKLNVDWTGLVREEFTRQKPDVGELTSRNRLTVGLSRRPKRFNNHHMLFLANWNVDFGPEDGADRTTYMLSTHQNAQLNNNTTLSGRFGARWSDTHFENGTIRSNVAMWDVRTTFDLARRWEFDVRAGWLGTGSIDDGRFALGTGLQWLARRNLRFGLHYNAFGFREKDLDEQGYNTQGVHIGLQLKFDEDSFAWLE